MINGDFEALIMLLVEVESGDSGVGDSGDEQGKGVEALNDGNTLMDQGRQVPCLKSGDEGIWQKVVVVVVKYQ